MGRGTRSRRLYNPDRSLVNCVNKLETKMQNKIRENFVRWYKLTHWNYDTEGLTFEKNGRFRELRMEDLFIAYRAGFNRANKESKGLK